MKRILSALLVIFGFLLFSRTAFASTLYLSPSNQTVGQGAVFYVQVRLDTTGVPVNGVTAVLQYPADKLKVASVSYGSTAFGIQAEETYNTGSLKLSRGSINPVTGNVNVATVGFRALGLGTAQPNFIGGSAVPKFSDSTDSLVLSQSTGGTYKVVPASELPSATPSSLRISNLKATNIASNSATITWTTTVQSDSTVEFGLVAGQYFVTASSPTLVTDHSVVLNGPVLSPGAKFHYHVISRASSGSAGTSPDEVFQLKGSQVLIKVVDASKNPLPNVAVELASYQEGAAQMTNSGGIVTFSDVIPGSYTVIVKSHGLESSSQISVKYDPQPQAYVVTTDFVAPSSNLIKLGDWMRNPIVWGAAGLLVVIIAGFIVLLWLRGKRSDNMAKLASDHMSNTYTSLFSDDKPETPETYKSSSSSDQS